MRFGWTLSVVFLLAGCAAGPKYQGVSPYGVFDAPVKVETKALPKDKLNPQMSPRVTCSRYPNFMIKEVDLGEKGAEKLAILPANAPCAKDGANEIRIDLEGYFKGVMGDYVFFDASDGWDGGVPFYVFDPSGKKLFEDSVAGGEFMMATREDKSLMLRFDRVYHAPCSMYEHTAECDNKVMEATGLGGEGAVPNLMLPDCKPVYDEELKRTDPKYMDALKESPSVIRYPVDLNFDGQILRVEANGWAPAKCSVPS